MAHDLPSARLLTEFQAFYRSAHLNKDGTCNISLLLPAEHRASALELANNDGLVLNVSVWETAMPEGDEVLARALGLEP